MDQRNPDDIAVLQLLDRIVAGEALEADRAALARWVAEDPARQKIVDTLRAEWGDVPQAHDVTAGWARMAERMRPMGAEQRPGSETPSASETGLALLAVASRPPTPAPTCRSPLFTRPPPPHMMRIAGGRLA